MINVAVIPSQSNAIRALHQAKPALGPREIARALGVHHHLVELALAKGDKRRTKSKAPGAGDGRHTR